MDNTPNPLDKKIDELFYGFITRYNFDIVRHKFLLDIFVKHNETKKDFLVEVSEISTYFFHESTLANSNNFMEAEDFIWDYSVQHKVIGLTSIEQFPNTISFQTKLDGWTQSDIHLQGTFNLQMELWESKLFIKANKIRINDDLFDLNTGQLIT